MRGSFIIFILAGALAAQTPAKSPQTLKDVLLEQLHTTHDQKDWFVPINVAVEGLTPEQAKWRDPQGGHSVGQLVNHLAFWNGRELQKFRGETASPYSGNNDETFNNFDAKAWTATVENLDSIMKAWEKAVAEADDAKLRTWASQIAHVGTHNAYHVGQIVSIRKLQGAWNPDKGVK